MFFFFGEITIQKLLDKKTNNDLLSNEMEKGSEILIFDCREENDLKNATRWENISMQ